MTKRKALRVVEQTKPSFPGAMQGEIVEMASGIDASVVTVTPEMATQWLEIGGVNRPLRQAWVETLAGRMKRGEWRLTGEAIKLDRYGHVRDGQHRLWAIMESNTAIRTLVVLNVPDDAFDVMDTGRSRTVADVLSLHGYENSKGTSAAARYSIIWDRGGSLASGSSGITTISAPQAREYLKQHPGLAEWATRCRRISRAHIPGGVGVYASVFYRLAQIDEAAAERFLDDFVSGAGLAPDSPILLLRNRVLGMRGRSDPNEVAALTIKAWNIWRRGGTLRLLGWRHSGGMREPFPKPE